MSLSDVESASMLAVSHWETAQAESAAYERGLVSEHCRAMEELLAAAFEAQVCPGAYSETRLMVAEVRLGRIEGRLGRR